MSDVAPDLDEFLPLTAPAYQILLALGGNTLHGYAIIQELERRMGRSGGLLPGSLYNTIARMLRAGLVEEPDETAAGKGERRRYYRVTALGRAVARAESQRLEDLLRIARDQDLMPERR